MRTVYSFLAYLVCALVALQAASHAWASAGLINYLSQGGVIDFTSDAPPPVPEFLGVMIHGMNGMFVIPVVSLALVGVAFSAKIPGGVARAVIVLATVIVQITLGLLGHSMTFLAFLHGVNALAVFLAAVLAARAAGAASMSATGRDGLARAV